MEELIQKLHLSAYVPQLVFTVITIALLSVSKAIAVKLVARYGRLTRKAEVRISHMSRIISILINIICIVVVAIIWGVQPQNLLLGISSIFAIIGVALFAQWSMLSNITAGILIYFGAPYHIGDKIRIIDKDMPIDATIETIMTFYTHLRTDDDELIVLPNNLFLQKVVALKPSDRPPGAGE